MTRVRGFVDDAPVPWGLDGDNGFVVVCITSWLPAQEVLTMAAVSCHLAVVHETFHGLHQALALGATVCAALRLCVYQVDALKRGSVLCRQPPNKVQTHLCRGWSQSHMPQSSTLVPEDSCDSLPSPLQGVTAIFMHET